MPTTAGIIILGLLVVGAVAGLVLWALQAQRRTHDLSRGTGPEAPWDENTAANQASRQADRGGMF